MFSFDFHPGINPERVHQEKWFGGRIQKNQVLGKLRFNSEVCSYDSGLIMNIRDPILGFSTI